MDHLPPLPPPQYLPTLYCLRTEAPPDQKGQRFAVVLGLVLRRGEELVTLEFTKVGDEVVVLIGDIGSIRELRSLSRGERRLPPYTLTGTFEKERRDLRSNYDNVYREELRLEVVRFTVRGRGGGDGSGSCGGGGGGGGLPVRSDKGFDLLVDPSYELKPGLYPPSYGTVLLAYLIRLSTRKYEIKVIKINFLNFGIYLLPFKIKVLGINFLNLVLRINFLDFGLRF
ncbi:hypothetical protein QBC39DRAFT_334204 [Podospora conica]|nr:hypothetical protein QBC39DRAFT_334204 [Schizothecium conicum]